MVEKSMKYINAYDPEIARVLELELMRQRTHIELIARQNAYGWLIGSLFVEPENWYHYQIQTVERGGRKVREPSSAVPVLAETSSPGTFARRPVPLGAFTTSYIPPLTMRNALSEVEFDGLTV